MLSTPLGVRIQAVVGSILMAACGTVPTLGPFTREGGAGVTLAPEAATAVQAIVDRFAGRAAIVVADGGSGRILHAVAPDERVLAGSLYKLAVQVEAERRIEAGTLRPGDRIEILAEDQPAEGGTFTPAGAVLTIDEALERAIVVSDNAPALALLRLLGADATLSTLAKEGVRGFRFEPDGATTTGRAVATLLGELVRGSLVSAEASRRMLARLARERITDRIPAALPRGTVIGHKTGSLGFATHDAAIVRGPGDAQVVLVILTWDSGEDAGVALIREVARAVHAGLAPVAGR